jgi:hypothetical protein
MKQQEMLERAGNEILTRAQAIAAMTSPQEISREYHRAFGYVCALRDMGICGKRRYNVAMNSLNEALCEATKKAAPGAENTESGSTGDHPEKDDSPNHHFSVDEKAADVKAPSIPLRRMVLAMQYACIDDSRIVAVLLNVLRPEKERRPG